MQTTEIVAGGDKALLNPNHELFCSLYATHSEFFGNATEAYIEAYDVDTTKPGHRNSAHAAASKLLRKSTILARVNFFLETRLNLNDVEVDKQLAFCIAQGADLRVKLAGIKEYNALKGRVKTKLELSFNDSSDAELNEELKAIEAELASAEALLASRKASQIVDIPGMPNLTAEQQAEQAQSNG